MKGASYYNVQLIQGRRILSAWPTRPQLRLPRTWIYQGQRYRLRAGRYRWYVWPGYGLLSAAHYGRLLGGSSFVVWPSTQAVIHSGAPSRSVVAVLAEA